MAEWLKALAWKTNPATLTDCYGNSSSRNRFNDFPPQNASRCEPVNTGIYPWFWGDLTQFLHSSERYFCAYVVVFVGTPLSLATIAFVTCAGRSNIEDGTAFDTPPSISVLIQAFDGREQVARPFAHKGRCSDLDGSLLDVRVVHRREHDDSCVWVVLLDLTAYLQSVDVGQVEVDHDHVGFESLRCF